MHQLKSGPAVAGSRKEEEVLFCSSLFCRPHFGSNGSLYARAARTRSLAATPDEALPAWLPFLSPRRIHTWHHEAPEAARPLQCPCDRMLVRCCTPSPRSALSTAGIWPPAGQAGAPLLENASLPATGQLSSAALHQPVRKATAHWTCSNALQLRGRLDRIYIIDLVEAPLSVSVLPHLRLAQLVESPATGDDPRRIRERTAS